MKSTTGRTISIRSTIFPERGLRVTAGFWLFLAVALLAGTPAVTAAVLLAAVMHECGHAALLLAFGVPIEGLRLGAFGAVIRARAGRLSYGRELAVTLAGPAVNLAAAPLIGSLSSGGWGRLLAGAHLVLGVYNLLPLPPLDGGRALYLLTAWRFGPDAGQTVSSAAGLLTAALLVCFGAYVTLTQGGTLFLLASLAAARSALPGTLSGKPPCPCRKAPRGGRG